MSSTSNKNTQGNYQLEQIAFLKNRNYDSYLGRVINTNTFLPGDGLLAGRMPSNILSENYTNIESELFGIGSTNLVQSKPFVVPELNTIHSLNIYDKNKTILPTNLIVDKHQRPFFLE